MAANIETHKETRGLLSRNVLLRTELDLFAQVVHCKTYPGIPGLKHGPLDIMIFRQNTEGEYSMKEHEVTSVSIVYNILFFSFELVV